MSRTKKLIFVITVIVLVTISYCWHSISRQKKALEFIKQSGGSYFKVEQEWISKLPAFLKASANSLFGERIEEVTLSKVTNIEFLDAIPELSSLTLSNCKINDFSTFLKLKNIKRLELWKVNFKDLSSLRKMKLLKELYINDNPISKLDGIEALKSLEYLNISSTRIRNIEPLKELPNLHELEFSWSDLPPKSYKQLRQLKKLFLSIPGKEVKKVQSLMPWCHVTNLPNFKRL